MKIFNHELKCGCMIADDTGTVKKPDGNVGMIPCYAEYGDMCNKEDKKALELHNESVKEFFDIYDSFGNKKC